MRKCRGLRRGFGAKHLRHVSWWFYKFVLLTWAGLIALPAIERERAQGVHTGQPIADCWPKNCSSALGICSYKLLSRGGLRYLMVITQLTDLVVKTGLSWFWSLHRLPSLSCKVDSELFSVSRVLYGLVAVDAIFWAMI